MKGSQTLNKAKKAKYDEFYSTYGEVDAELSLYPEQIAGLDVFLPFDGPDSAFTHWFLDHPELGCRVRRTESLFPSAAWDEAFLGCELVTTNPPFSQFIPFFKRLVAEGVRFLVMCPLTAVCYVDVFPYIARNEVRLGQTRPREFIQPEGNVRKMGNTYWMTNLEVPPKTLDYAPAADHPMLVDEPYGRPCMALMTYKDVFLGAGCDLAVPLSYIDHYDPEAFELLGILQSPVIMEDGKPRNLFKRIAIRERSDR